MSVGETCQNARRFSPGVPFATLLCTQRGRFAPANHSLIGTPRAYDCNAASTGIDLLVQVVKRLGFAARVGDWGQLCREKLVVQLSEPGVAVAALVRRRSGCVVGFVQIEEALTPLCP